MDVFVVAAQSGGGGWGAAYTDEGGAYTMAGLPTGTYIVTATMAGYAEGRETGVVVTWMGNAQVDFALDPIPIEVSHTFAAGWNLISLPIAPVDPDPATVFGALPISGRLYRYDVATKGYIGYYTFDPGPFGEMECGEGYWLYCDASSTVTYQGYANDGPQSIALAGGWWSLIGHPFQTAVALADCQVRRVSDGEVRTFAEAASAGWVEPPAYTWSPSLVSYQAIDLEVPPAADDHLRAWAGYWFSTGPDAVELIVPMP
jgi:hypothetical protein